MGSFILILVDAAFCLLIVAMKMVASRDTVIEALGICLYKEKGVARRRGNSMESRSSNSHSNDHSNQLRRHPKNNETATDSGKSSAAKPNTSMTRTLSSIEKAPNMEMINYAENSFETISNSTSEEEFFFDGGDVIFGSSVHNLFGSAPRSTSKRSTPSDSPKPTTGKKTSQTEKATVQSLSTVVRSIPTLFPTDSPTISPIKQTKAPPSPKPTIIATINPTRKITQTTLASGSPSTNPTSVKSVVESAALNESIIELASLNQDDGCGDVSPVGGGYNGGYGDGFYGYGGSRVTRPGGIHGLSHNHYGGGGGFYYGSNSRNNQRNRDGYYFQGSTARRYRKEQNKKKHRTGGKGKKSNKRRYGKYKPRSYAGYYRRRPSGGRRRLRSYSHYYGQTKPRANYYTSPHYSEGCVSRRRYYAPSSTNRNSGYSTALHSPPSYWGQTFSGGMPSSYATPAWHGVNKPNTFPFINRSPGTLSSIDGHGTPYNAFSHHHSFSNVAPPSEFNTDEVNDVHYTPNQDGGDDNTQLVQHQSNADKDYDIKIPTEMDPDGSSCESGDLNCLKCHFFSLENTNAECPDRVFFSSIFTDPCPEPSDILQIDSFSEDAFCADYTSTACTQACVKHYQTCCPFSCEERNGCTTCTKRELDLRIDPPSMIESTFEFPSIGRVQELVFTLEMIRHTFAADLIVELESPEGSRATVLNDEEASSNFDEIFKYTFADNAIFVNITECSLAGTDDQIWTFEDCEVQPFDSFTKTFSGDEAGGVWKVGVSDTQEGDGGVLDAYSVKICPGR